MNWEWTSKSNHFTWSFRSLRIEITILNCSFLVRTSKVIEVQAHILACGSVNAKLKSQSHSIEKWVTHIGAKIFFEVAFHFSKIFLHLIYMVVVRQVTIHSRYQHLFLLFCCHNSTISAAFYTYRISLIIILP